MTSLNAVVVSIRLVVSAVVQRLLFDLVGAEGLFKIGQLRSLTQLLTSLTSFGVFNGVVKYLSEYKDDKPKLQQLFSTAFVFMVVGTLLSGVVLFIFAIPISNYLFTDSVDYSFVIRFVALAAPSIAVQRVFSGVVNGLSEYKKFAKIELISYLISIAVLVVCLYQYNLSGVLIAIPGYDEQVDYAAMNDPAVTITGTPADNYPDEQRTQFCSSDKIAKSTKFVRTNFLTPPGSKISKN